MGSQYGAQGPPAQLPGVFLYIPAPRTEPVFHRRLSPVHAEPHPHTGSRTEAHMSISFSISDSHEPARGANRRGRMANRRTTAGSVRLCVGLDRSVINRFDARKAVSL
jgi:hypothetical protein